MDKIFESAQVEPAEFAPAIVHVMPHRSLSWVGLWMFLALQSFCAFAFAGLAAWQGNVFAPVFAVVELLFVAYCLLRIWRRSAQGEVITLTRNTLRIQRSASALEPVQMHPYWAQVQLRPGRKSGWPTRLLLRSHGREVEVGAFLNEAERADLALRLTQLLKRYRS